MTGPQPPRALRLVVMGTGPFAVPMFGALVGSRHAVAALVTRPDRAAPGRRPPPNPMRAAALAAGVPVLDPADVNDAGAIAEIARLAPDLLVVCDYGRILAPALLAAAPLGGINLHGSLLPRHRGAAPVQWAILEGDPVTGACVIHMTPALDAGGVILARSTPIDPRETAAALEARLAAFGPELVLAAIDELARPGRPPGPCGAPQDPACVTRAPRLTKADGIVDWSQPAARIARLPRALDPWPRATTFLRLPGHAPLRLVVAEAEEGAAAGQGAGPRPGASAAPGTILRAGTDGIEVACGDGGTVVVTRVVPEGKRPMAVGEFLLGRHVGPGASLGPGGEAPAP
jgi:methionyl-tRNA formyltransferase